VPKGSIDSVDTLEHGMIHVQTETDFITLRMVCNSTYKFFVYLFIYLFWAVVVFKLRTLHLLGKCSTT
jgi:hypothetical protein